MYWTILILVNLPIYFFLAWVVFDTKDKAADTFFETILAILKIIFVPRIVRVMLDMDDSGAFGLLEIGLFLGGCVAVTFGEHWLLQTYFFGS